ncbi:dipeptidase [Clostridium rectalis]|uniref:dipeptidase n=1 Tax=Clostridium rectalis TaxID=2040295 RepID=UPI000F63578A|nr:dipeptidase [Clostridium rectalis]
MSIIDMHCDTIYKLMADESIGLRENNISIDLKKLKKANSKAQFFAMFIDKSEHSNVLKRFYSMVDKFLIEIHKNKDYISLAKNYNEMNENFLQDKISAFLTIEEGAALEGNIENLEKFYDLGVRLITLTWNYPNEIGYPNTQENYMKNGLTEFGIEVVEKMNKLGMIIDVSHLSDEGFYDVAKYSNKPFVASHSDARFIKNHPRNLTDHMIKILSESGGVMGINFSSNFLGNSKVSKIEDMITHIKHIKNVGGIDCIAIGTDFDGIGNEVEIKDFGEMDKLVISLEKNSFSQGEIEKILNKNAERVIKDTLK